MGWGVEDTESQSGGGAATGMWQLLTSPVGVFLWGASHTFLLADMDITRVRMLYLNIGLRCGPFLRIFIFSKSLSPQVGRRLPD